MQVSSLNPNNLCETNQGEEDKGKKAIINQIDSLFFYSNPKLTMVLDDMIRGVSKGII